MGKRKKFAGRGSAEGWGRRQEKIGWEPDCKFEEFVVF
jgi:hypothetical protein